MSTAAVNYEVRHRVGGSEPTEWVTQVFPASTDIVLDELTRGTQYEIQIRAVARNGKKSEWVQVSQTVATTNREGALALPTNVVANQASMWDVNTTVTYSATSDATGVSTATISVSSGTLIIGAKTIAYSASSATVSGTASQIVTYYLYYDDPMLEGGSKALGLATNVTDSANVDGRIAIVTVTLTFPAAGSTSSGGGSIGGSGGSSGACVVIESWLPGGIQAGNVQVGDVLLLCDPITGIESTGTVTFAETREVPCVQIQTDGGIVLRCSRTAPIPTRNGLVLAPDLLGLQVPTRIGPELTWQYITSIQDIGMQQVRHITVGDQCFWAGAVHGAYLLHHNSKMEL